MRIDIYQDLICPWCYIGSHRFKRALASRPDLTRDIVWQPFQLNPTMPATGVERQIYLTAKFGGKERAAEVYQIVADTAAADDLPLRLDLIRRTPNTLDAHRLVRLVAAQGGTSRRPSIPCIPPISSKDWISESWTFWWRSRKDWVSTRLRCAHT